MTAAAVKVDPRAMPLNWRLAKRYPVVQAVDGREVVRMVPYELARRVVRFSGWCVGEHDRGPVAAEEHSWLCWRCTEDLRKALLGIEERWPVLQDLLHPSGGGGDEVRSKSVDPAVPLALEYVEASARMDFAVRMLVSQLIEDRPDLRLVGGENTGPVAGLLGRWHMSWMTGHPSSSLVAAALPEVWDAWKEMPAPARVKEFGRCPAADCSGTLRKEPGGLLVCSVRVSHSYEPSSWVDIAKARRAEDRPQWLSLDDAAMLTGWAPSTVLKRASLDGWRKKGTKPQRWDSRDVIRSKRDTPRRGGMTAV
jgi:hypothetical protein